MKTYLTIIICVAMQTYCYAQQSQLTQLTLEPFANGLQNPVGLYNMGDERIFVLEKDECDIEILNPSGTNVGKFLDLTGSVSTGGERGLLGMAFHPDYSNNGKFYVNYTNNLGNTVVSEFSVSADPNLADPSSEDILLTISQDFSNHNGGHIAFGADGYLYIGMGDGGSAGDPNNRSQNMSSLLGKMLRIEVTGNGTYSIPNDNPFLNNSTIPEEIWSIGLRNPWKFSFDSETGDLWIGDVGQSVKEEINYEPANSSGGINYGWRCKEGFSDYNPAGCSGLTLTDPVADYTHSFPDGPCSITGGMVYRGAEFQNMVGHYFLTDYCDGKIFSLFPDGAGGFTETLLLETGTFGYVAFGTDQLDNMYMVNVNGNIVKITDPCSDLSVSVSFNGTTLSASSALADTYQWFLNGNAINNANASAFTPENTGVYTCEVYTNDGCTALASQSFNLAVGTYLAGCTQACANNFNPSASVDDGSCVYDGIGDGFGCASCPGDFNGDGSVSTADLTGFLSVFGNACN